MRLLLLIVGLVLGSYLLFTALARSRLKKYAKFHEEFDQTLLENSHAVVKPKHLDLQGVHDPLLDIGEEEEIAAVQTVKMRTVTQEKVVYAHKNHRSDSVALSHQVPSTPYAWETALAEEEIIETLSTQEPLYEDDQAIEEPAWEEEEREEQAWEAENEFHTEKSAISQKDFIAFSILPKNRMGFTGHTLLSALKVNYFYYGKQKVFNRHLGDDPHQPVLFSVASLVEPGIFEQTQMSKNVFPGVIIFMLLPSSTNAMTTFEKMFTTARQLADSLNADLCDMSRNPLNIHTLGQYRDRIRANQYVRFSQDG